MENKTRSKQVIWRDFEKCVGEFPEKIAYANKEAVKKVNEHMHNKIKMRK